LEDKGGGELVDPMAAGVAIGGVVAGGFEYGVGLGGGEALVPEVNGEAGAFRARDIAGCLTGGLGNECSEIVYEAVDALGLSAEISGEVQRIADDDARAAVAPREAKDGALIAAGLRALDGKERLGDAEGAGERDTNAARTDIEAEPGMG
jgi:hypothetical protein